MPDEIRIKHETLVAFISQSLAAVGVPSPIREVEAEVMAEADLLGVPSHGVQMLTRLVKASARDAPIRTRVCRSCASASDVRPRRRQRPGRYTAVQAMSHAVERARQFGVGVCLAVKTTHWGRAHSFAYRAAQAGMIGLCTTNAIPICWPGFVTAIARQQSSGDCGTQRTRSRPNRYGHGDDQAAVGKVSTFLREGKKVHRAGTGRSRSTDR